MKLHHVLGGVLLAASSQGYTAPPVNPWLANSPAPLNHLNSYQQDSVPVPGPLSASDLGMPQLVNTGYINIAVNISPIYPDGSRVYWGANAGNVYKLAVANGQLQNVATLPKPKPDGGIYGTFSSPTAGVYTMVDHENTFYAVVDATLLTYKDENPKDPLSKFKLANQYTPPLSVVEDGDKIVGLNMLYDGNIAAATAKGKVVVIRRDLTASYSIVLGDGKVKEEISNSVATDENGGIYVATSKAMYRVQWTGKGLSLDPKLGGWRTLYKFGTECAGDGNMGCGTGSTPTLMGSGADPHKFVVITDGMKVSNIVLFWRDKIPSDWKGIAPGRDRRIAAEVPVNFGERNREQTQSEQSVVVSGYGAAVVSNDYRNFDKLPSSTGFPFIDTMLTGIIVWNSGDPLHQPWGVQKFQWDPAMRKLTSRWARRDVSCPNGVPTMSEISNSFYCVGAFQNNWTIESLDWITGITNFRKILGRDERLNSYYSDLVLTGDGGFIYGTTFGAAYLPSTR